MNADHPLFEETAAALRDLPSLHRPVSAQDRLNQQHLCGEMTEGALYLFEAACPSTPSGSQLREELLCDLAEALLREFAVADTVISMAQNNRFAVYAKAPVQQEQAMLRAQSLIRNVRWMWRMKHPGYSPVLRAATCCAGNGATLDGMIQTATQELGA